MIMSTRTLGYTLALATLLGALTARAATTRWKVDSTHARIGFSIPHMMVSEVAGTFRDYTASVVLDERDLTASRVAFTAKVASIDTDDAKRDEHLRGPDFFDAAKHPEIHFEATSIKKARGKYILQGPLTMHGVTKTVSLEARVSEPVADPWGHTVRGVAIQGTIDRKDFGLTWNKALDRGGFAIGDEVRIDVKLEIQKQSGNKP